MNDNPYLAIERGGPGTIGWRIHHYAEVGSTQEVAEQLALDGAAHGTVVIAESQSAGRGRLGREWFSPSGVNLHCTAVLRPRMAVPEVPVIGLVAGVAPGWAPPPNLLIRSYFMSPNLHLKTSALRLVVCPSTSAEVY